MVKVKESESFSKVNDFSFSKWQEKLKVERNQKDKLMQAFDFFISNIKEQKLKNEYIKTSCMVTEILLDLNLDLNSIVTGIFLDAFYKKQISLSTIEDSQYSEIIENLQELKKLEDIHIKLLEFVEDSNKIYDGLRKMLLAVVADLKIVLVKLAHHTCELRNSAYKEEEIKTKLALVTEKVYAPLVNRLGIGQLKWELEDLSFRFLNPLEYKKIAKSLDETRIARENYINDLTSNINKTLIEKKLNCELTCRVKHIYSIWKKMQRKMISYEEINDIRALRIIVDDIESCYSVLGIIHSTYQHIPKEFDDYIANPKSNGYQSIHTAVLGPKGKVVEIQIRTKKMHEQSEIGVAAHWKYKEGNKLKQDYEKKISQLQQLLKWHTELKSSDESLQLELFKDRVYIFTPKGDVIDLAEGATPIDFAYHVHTEVGHRCRGAKVNGKIVTLNTPLANGQQLEIVTIKEGGPSRDWLSGNYVKTARARIKILDWFKKQDKDKNIQAGKDILLREFKRLGIRDVSIESLFKKIPGFTSENEFLSAIGFGDVRMTQVLGAIQRIKKPKIRKDKVAQIQKEPEYVCLDGVGKLNCYFAKCCNPLPGEQIIGYISSERGVTVHNYSCSNVKEMIEKNLDKLVDVNWSDKESLYSVDLVLIGVKENTKLLRSIAKVMDENNIKINNLNFDTSISKKTTYNITIELDSIQKLSKIIDLLNQIDGIEDAKRKN